MGENITEENEDAILEEALEKNPEFAKKLLDARIDLDPANPTKVFKSVALMKNKIPFLNITEGLTNGTVSYKTEDIKKDLAVDGERSKEAGTGEFGYYTSSYLKNLGNNDIFEYLTGKKTIYSELKSLTSKDYFSIDTNTDEHEYRFACKSDPQMRVVHSEIKTYGGVPVRLLFLKKDNILAKAGVTDSDGSIRDYYGYNTIGHLEYNQFYTIKDQFFGKFNYSTDKNDEIDLQIGICITNTTDYVSIRYKVIKNAKNIELICVPLILDKEKILRIDQEINDAYDRVKDDIINRLAGNKDTYKTETDYQYAKDFIEYRLNTDNISKSAFLWAYDLNAIAAIPDIIDSQSGKIDSLVVPSYLYPRFGEEVFSDETLEKHVVTDEYGVCILDKTDINNLGFLNLDKKIIEDISKNASETIKTTFKTIEALDASIEKIESDDNYKEVIFEDFDSSIDSKEFDEWFNKNNLINDRQRAVEHIEDVKSQVLNLKMTSVKIAKKIHNGSFSNMYMVTGLNILYGVFENKGLIHKENNKYVPDYSVWTHYLERMCMDKITAENSNYYSTILYNTVFNSFDADPFGNKPTSLFSLYESNANTFVDGSIIAEDLSGEEETHALVDSILAENAFYEGLYKDPFRVVEILIPKIHAAKYGTELKDVYLEEQKKIIDIGFEYFENYTSDESEEISNLIGNTRILIKQDYEGNKKIISKLVKAFDNSKKFIKRVETKKFKNRSDKIKILSQYSVLIGNLQYIRSITDKESEYSESLTDTTPIADLKLIVRNISNNEEISVEDYLKMSEEEKSSYVVIKKLTDDEVINVILDYLIYRALGCVFFIEYGKIENEYMKIAAMRSAEKTKKTIEMLSSSEEKTMSKMFKNVLKLVVPSIAILEMFDVNSVEGDDISKEVEALIHPTMKVKLGTDSCNMAIESLKNKQNLYKAREKLVKVCVSHVLNAIKVVNFLVKYLVEE